jgi:carboxypeptidase PM20D1
VTNALIRTSTAITMVNGGVKDNVLPARAQATVNFRLMPGDRVADVENYVRKVVADDAVLIDIPEGAAWEASPVSSFHSSAAAGLLRAIGQVYPEAVPAPFLMTGATDARYYGRICEDVFRFTPYLMSMDELHTIHSSNEHIAIDRLARMVQFYIRLVRAWTEKE